MPNLQPFEITNPLPIQSLTATANGAAIDTHQASGTYESFLAIADIGAFTGTSGTAASLTTALTGANNDLVFTAKSVGTAGNSITITYVDPGEETAEESVVVTDSDIVVTLRSVSATLSTAAQVKAAIEAEAAADALVSVANAGGDNGTGEVIALAETALTGGVNDLTLNLIFQEDDASNFASPTTIESRLVEAEHTYIFQLARTKRYIRARVVIDGGDTPTALVSIPLIKWHQADAPLIGDEVIDNS